MERLVRSVGIHVLYSLEVMIKIEITYGARLMVVRRAFSINIDLQNLFCYSPRLIFVGLFSWPANKRLVFVSCNFTCT
jgi:hypothetical protein